MPSNGDDDDEEFVPEVATSARDQMRGLVSTRRCGSCSKLTSGLGLLRDDVTVGRPQTECGNCKMFGGDEPNTDVSVEPTVVVSLISAMSSLSETTNNKHIISVHNASMLKPSK